MDTLFYKQNLQDHVTEFGETKVINVYPYRILEISKIDEVKE